MSRPGADEVDGAERPAPDESFGVVLGGRYVLGDVIGAGASAVVYEASERGSPPGAPLAAKVLHAHLARDPAARAELVAEARAAARVRHPGLVRVLDVGEEDLGGEIVAWIVMSRAPGVTLADLVSPRGSTTPVRDGTDATEGLALVTALTIAERILDALDAAHFEGLVHQDVAPRNVMVELAGGPGEDARVGAVTLLDLGLAATSRRADGLVVGTAVSMSPEQASGLAADARSDLYAVGALLYLMLTGHAPFERSDAASVLRAHVESPVPVPSARADVPRAVDRLVVRALAKNPDRRYPSAAGMRDEVRALRASLDRSGRDAGRTRVMAPAETRDGPPRAMPGVSLTVPRALPGAALTAPRARMPEPFEAQGSDLARPPAIVVALVIASCLACLTGLGWLVVHNDAPRDAEVRGPRSAATSSASSAPVVPASDLTSTDAPAPTVPALTVEMPDLETLDLGVARGRLLALGLAVAEVSQEDSSSAVGTVLASDPAARGSVVVGDTVTLTVASGWNQVPQVAGDTLDRALERLTAAGFVCAQLASPDPYLEAGSVIEVDPSAGSRGLLGSLVTVVVSDGPPSPSVDLPAIPGGATSGPQPGPTTSPTSEQSASS